MGSAVPYLAFAEALHPLGCSSLTEGAAHRPDTHRRRAAHPTRTRDPAPAATIRRRARRTRGTCGRINRACWSSRTCTGPTCPRWILSPSSPTRRADHASCSWRRTAATRFVPVNHCTDGSRTFGAPAPPTSWSSARCPDGDLMVLLRRSGPAGADGRTRGVDLPAIRAETRSSPRNCSSPCNVARKISRWCCGTLSCSASSAWTMNSRSALRVLAAAGRDTSHALLAAVVSLPEPDLREALRRAVQRQRAHFRPGRRHLSVPPRPPHRGGLRHLAARRA